MIGFYIAESFRYFRRSKLATFISIVTLCIGILFTLLSLVMLVLSSRIDEKFKSRIELEVFLEDSVDAVQRRGLEKELSSNQIVKEIEFVDKEIALKNLKSETGDDFASILTYNPLPNSLKIKFGKDVTEESLNEFRNIVKRKAGVIDVVYDHDLVLSLLQFIKSVKLIIYVVSVLLILISIYLVYSNSRLILMSKSDQFYTMKLVGAKLSTIKIPLVLNGFSKGFLSGVISLLVIRVILITLKKFSFDTEFVNIVYFFNLLPLIIGSFLGALGSILFARTITLKVNTKDKLKK